MHLWFKGRFFILLHVLILCSYLHLGLLCVIHCCRWSSFSFFLHCVLCNLQVDLFLYTKCLKLLFLVLLIGLDNILYIT